MVPPMRFLFLSFLAVLSLSALAIARPASDSAHYRTCLTAASGTNPAFALGDAEGWAKSGGGIPARHCAALALVGLKRYGEAGTLLDKLAADRAVPDVGFRAELFDQAGNAWLLAGDGAKAVQSFSAALALSADDADLFADLARAQAMRKDWHEVDLDLNAALQLQPRRADLLVLRASARRALKRYGDARSDIAAALKLKPNDPDALMESGLLRRQVGDIGGARRDFEAVLKAVPTGAAARDAKDNLYALGPR